MQTGLLLRGGAGRPAQGHRLGTRDDLYGGETPEGSTVTFGPADLSLPVR
ncbi:hypothetical protein [Kitasatospora sp. NPDC093558]